MASKEVERNARRLAIEAMTADFMTAPSVAYQKIIEHQNESKSIDIEDIEIETDEYIPNSSYNKNNNDDGPEVDFDEFKTEKSNENKKEAKDYSKSIRSEIINDTDALLDEFTQKRKIPVSHQIDLGSHTKAVVSISVDPSGNRVVSGSLDYNSKMFDFGGMDSRHRPFNSIEPTEGHPVISISHSPNGDRFIVGSGSFQPKVFTRDGESVITFVRGDMYLRDLSNTKVFLIKTCLKVVYFI